MSETSAKHYNLWQLMAYFLRLGTLGFGGPVALVGYMHRDLVDQRGWIGNADYKEGLALAQIAPGPLAAQLAMYLGYVDHGVLGATLVGLAFVLPSFFMVVALGWAYLNFGGLAWMQSVFYGVGASVIGIMSISAHKLATKNIGQDKLLWAIFAAMASVTIATQSEMAGLFLACGVLVWVVRCKPRFGSGNMGSVLPLGFAGFALAGEGNVLVQIALFFTKAGAFVFGSGLAIVPFLYGGVVTEHHWLNDKQFVDAVAVAMITPGPVVITTGFIGYLVDGFAGACVAAGATFIPCYLVTVVAAPYFRKYGRRPALVAFVSGITAAAVGAIAGSVIVLATRAIIDLPTAILALGSAGVLWKVKLPEPVIVVAAAIVGLVVYPLLHH
jgi:chromate transporter